MITDMGGQQLYTVMLACLLVMGLHFNNPPNRCHMPLAWEWLVSFWTKQHSHSLQLMQAIVKKKRPKEENMGIYGNKRNNRWKYMPYVGERLPSPKFLVAPVWFWNLLGLGSTTTWMEEPHRIWGSPDKARKDSCLKSWKAAASQSKQNWTQ